MSEQTRPSLAALGPAVLIVLVGWALARGALDHRLGRVIEMPAAAMLEDIEVVGEPAAAYAPTPGTRFPPAGFPVRLKPETHYRLCLPVQKAQSAGLVTVDVAGAGYDTPAQEHEFRIKASPRTRHYCFDFASANPPPDTLVRVMPLGPVAARFGTPTFLEGVAPEWLRFLGRLLATIGVAGFAAALIAPLWRSWSNTGRLQWEARALDIARFAVQIALLAGIAHAVEVAVAHPLPVGVRRRVLVCVAREA